MCVRERQSVCVGERERERETERERALACFQSEGFLYFQVSQFEIIVLGSLHFLHIS